MVSLQFSEGWLMEIPFFMRSFKSKSISTHSHFYLLGICLQYSDINDKTRKLYYKCSDTQTIILLRQTWGHLLSLQAMTIPYLWSLNKMNTIQTIIKASNLQKFSSPPRRISREKTLLDFDIQTKKQLVLTHKVHKLNTNMYLSQSNIESNR